MITFYEEDRDLNSNSASTFNEKPIELEKKVELNSDRVEQNDLNSDTWINQIFQKNPVVKKTFLFVNNVFERNYVEHFQYALTGMLTGIVSPMGFAIKDPGIIQTWQGMITQFYSSLNESQINSRLHELKAN